MKRKEETLMKKLPPVKLYLDDINKIDEQMRNSCSRIEYSDNEYEFESLEELKEKRGNKINELGIDGYEPYISLDIHKDHVLLYTNSESQEVIGLWHTLRDFLESKVGWYYRVLNPWVWGIGLTIYITIGESLLKKAIGKAVTDEVSMSIGFTMLFFFVLCFLSRWKGSTIYLERRHKVSSFWERNRDNIIMIIIGAIIGAFLTLLGTVLVKFLFK